MKSFFGNKIMNSTIPCRVKITDHIREGFKKKNVKKYGLLPNRGGGGSARVVKNQTAFLKKVFFREYLESF